MIDQALIFSCDKLRAFILSRSHFIGIPEKLSNHAMIPAKMPYFPDIQNNS
jgi:hypothetical protein